MSLWICPICGKQNSIKYYDPTDFVIDILIILLRGLGKGKSFEEVDRYSLLDGSDPELLDLISDRVAVIYNLLYEDDEAEKEHPDIEDDDDNEQDPGPLSEIDKELLIFDQEEDDDEAEEELPIDIKDDDEEEEDEDINDLDEDIIE